jgi:spore coat polysaccharide biosynthesis protein SpsF
MDNSVNKKVLVIIQARMGSTRLPEKIFKDIVGKPMLWHMINRLKCSKKINDVVIAIPDSALNDKLESFVKELGVNCFRGDEDDVLSRYYGAAVKFQGDIIVRLTSDCPLIDPVVTDSTIEAHLNSESDYTYKGPRGNYPRGLDTEVFNLTVLKKIYHEATRLYEREHVTPYIYQHPELFEINVIQAVGKLKRPELRLTVDTEEDLLLVREIYRHLYQNNKIFYIEDIIDLLDLQPELMSINAHIEQKSSGND